MARHCGICGQAGHYQSTCPNRNGSVVGNSCAIVTPTTDNEQTPPLNLQLSTEGSAQPSDEVTFRFVSPRKGLWLVSESRRRIAGKILQVKSDGSFLYENVLGAYCESTPEKVKESDYQFVDLQPKMLTWRSI